MKKCKLASLHFELHFVPIWQTFIIMISISISTQSYKVTHMFLTEP